MIIGIDCGYRTGGVAMVSDDASLVYDLPVFDEGGVDVRLLMDMLTGCGAEHIYIEKQGAMPKQGVASTFKLGYAFGQIVATAGVSGVPYTLVTPATWKRNMNVPKDKDSARRMAIQWFPDLSGKLARKKDEHRAEALLIALYGRGKV